MFRLLVRVPPSACVFASGLMVSVATSATAALVFGDPRPAHPEAAIPGIVCALISGILWFTLSESLASVVSRIDSHAVIAGDREIATQQIARRSRKRLLSLFVLTMFLSVLWPWAGLIRSKMAQVRPPTSPAARSAPKVDLPTPVGPKVR